MTCTHLRKMPILAMSLLELAACASRPINTDVSAALIVSTSADRYVMQRNERFLMPLTVEAPLPTYPSNAVTPTEVTICVAVAITDEGDVQSVTTIATDPACSSVSDPRSKPFQEATMAAVREWKYLAAAICRYQTDVTECEFETADIKPVPVTLAYRFAFSTHDGKPVVRSVEAR
jgi:hypothetical protein